MKKVYIIIVVIAILAGYNTYKVYNTEHLSNIALINLEALADFEYDSPCVEWVTKACHDEFFQNANDPGGYHATCSGTPSVTGGMLECGAVTGRLPMYPFEDKKCLDCVRTSSGGEVG